MKTKSKQWSIVLDTNIYLSGLLLPQSTCGQILDLARKKKFNVYCSLFILEEIKKNLLIKFDYPEILVNKLIEEILRFAIIIKPKKKINIIKEKDADNRILECALSAKVDYLISGDKKHILPLKEFRGVKIISARQFLDLFVL